jgi:beta-glucosidase
MTDGTRFPEGFLWGAATSAYQVEGSPLADGAGPSIWHRFCHTPGLVRGGDTGDVACDHYRRWREDVGWMKELGLSAYRFSVSWSRVLPEGTGRVNPKGLDFYRGLVDALLEAGIQPCATLYHWDLPAALDDRGGWQNRDVADWFAEYARVLFGALDDRVPMWMTVNEPWVVSDGGYLHGVLAPGHRSLFEAPIVSHNLLRAHGAAVAAYRADGRHRIGLVVNLEPKYPASESPEDLVATRRSDAYMNRQFLDPVFLGRYPEELPEIFGLAWPEFPAADFDTVRRPIDFLGVNYYTRGVVRHDPKAWPVGAAPVRQPCLHTEMEWEVYPDGLFDTLRRHTALRDRERRCLRRSSALRPHGRGRAPRRVPAGAPAGGAPCDRCGHRPARLLRLVTAGQLRVVARLFQALRVDPRGLRHAGADAETERAILLRGHPSQRRGD